MTLLIAEDNVRIREMLKDMVKSFFTEIFECGNGQEAYKLYSLNKPDWTLMDIEMPVMDGITATRKITENYPEAKVVIVTNYDSSVLRKGAEEAGALNYILKENSGDIIEILKHYTVN